MRSSQQIYRGKHLERPDLSDPTEPLLYPLTIAQRDIWIAQLLDPVSDFLTACLCLEYFGAVDITFLEQALRQTVNENDGQHLNFVGTNDGPRQYFRSVTNFDIPLLDFTNEKDPRDAAMAWMLSDRTKAFDLSNGLLIRYAIIKIAPERLFLYGVNHHLITDWFSSSLFVRRVSQLYDALVERKEAPRPDSVSFLKLVEDETAYLGSRRHARDRDYWRDHLANRPDIATLSNRSPHWPGAAIKSEVIIPGSIVERLERLGTAHGASLSAVIMAAVAIYQARITGVSDLILGMPVSGRTSPMMRRVVGLATNVVPLRLVVDLNGTIGTLLKQVGRRVRDALRHQRYPASELRADLGLTPDHPALYGTLVNSRPADGDLNFAGGAIRKHDLTEGRIEDFMVATRMGGPGADMRLDFSANGRHYDKTDIEAHRRRFVRLVEQIATAYGQPDQSLYLLEILSAEERRVLSDFADGGLVAPPKPFPALFEAQAAASPDAQALIFGGEQLTYGALNRRANRLAHRLIREGIGPEDLVGVSAVRSSAMIVGLLAILKAGAAYLPLDPAYPEGRLAFMLADAKPSLILTEAGVSLPGGPRLLVISEAEETKSLEHNPTDRDRRAPLRVDHPAYVIYTSGSTGTPKGVVVTHRGIAALSEAQTNQLSLSPKARVLQFASLSFDASVWEIVMAFASGAALVLLAPETLGTGLVEHSISHALLSPTVLATLRPDQNLPLDCLIVGGEACPPPLAEIWSQGRRMINAYGPTETTVCATMSAPLNGRETPIGSPIAGSRVYILDNGLEPVPIGVTGELYIAGAGLARGYLNRPALTAERFVADPYGSPGGRMYRTGDLGRWRADGQIEYLGRADQQLKIRGFRVEPGEIENAITAETGIIQAAVIDRTDGAASNYLAAYLVPAPGIRPDPTLLRRQLSQKLPEHMIPAAFVIVERLPLTLNGKLDRAALPVPDRASDARGTNAYESPTGPVEIALAEIWAELLGLDRISRHDNFFELGGNSLMALQVVSRLRDRFNQEMPLKILFRAGTLTALAAEIDTAAQTLQDPPRVPPIAALSHFGPVPLSHSQGRMWLIQSLDPENTAYNIAIALKLSGPLVADTAVRAFETLVHRHEILRTRIRLVEGRPVQEVHPWSGQALALVDCQAGGESAAVRAAQMQARQPFDLTREPVIRATLYQISSEVHLLAMVLHHVAGDQWSMGVLGRELALLYNGMIKGALPSLPLPPISYRDYAVWQRDAALASEFDRQLSYWREQLADLPILDLPTDRPRPLLPSLRGAFCEAPLSDTLLEGLVRLGLEASATSFMILLAAFVSLLHRLTGQADIPLGVPVANRTQSATESLVGTFVNTLVMRLDLSGSPSFRTMLQRVRETALNAFTHQDISFDRLVQEIGQLRDANRAPLVQVLFNVTNAPMQGIVIDDIAWEPIPLDRGGAQFELSLSIDINVTRRFSIEYNTDLYDRGTIERFMGHYLTMLEAAIAKPETILSALPMLSATEHRALLHWNATSEAYPEDRIFVQLFESQAAASPTMPAVCFEGSITSYGELNAQANTIAHALRALGIGPGSLVGLSAPRSPALLAALIGIQKSGGAYVPLDPGFPIERLSYMLADSGARVLVTAGDAADRMRVPEGVAILDLDTMSEDQLLKNPQGAARPTDTAYLIYTSGSTGRPKGVAVPHGAVMNFLWSMRRRPGLSGSDILAAVTTISFDIAVLELYLPLLTGARIELVPQEIATDGAALAHLIDTSGVTVLQATPTTWRLLVEAGWRGHPNFRALCGGEPLPRDLANAILDRAGELWNLYGPTETTVWSTVDRVERDDAPISIGGPINNTTIHILDSGGERVPIGVAGEIFIGGLGVAKGYHRRAALTAERFIPDRFSGRTGTRLYRTGDLGRWGANGKLYHLGRLDHQVKIRGFRIELGEVEAVIAANESVLQAAVTAGEAQPGDLRIIAYIVYRSGEELTAGDLRRQLRRQLPNFMIPSAVVTLDSIPLTPNGKIDRNALPNPFKTTRRAMRAKNQPAPGLEQKMADIWRSILAVDAVNAEDNFFELGGHSLLSLRVAQEIEKETGYRLDPRALFFNSLRQVATLVARGTGVNKK
jgi:nonribosomal peptide synthetase DhbF